MNLIFVFLSILALVQANHFRKHGRAHHPHHPHHPSNIAPALQDIGAAFPNQRVVIVSNGGHCAPQAHHTLHHDEGYFTRIVRESYGPTGVFILKLVEMVLWVLFVVGFVALSAYFNNGPNRTFNNHGVFMV